MRHSRALYAESHETILVPHRTCVPRSLIVRRAVPSRLAIQSTKRPRRKAIARLHVQAADERFFIRLLLGLIMAALLSGAMAAGTALVTVF